MKEQGGAEQNEHQRTRDRLEHQLTTLREEKDSGQLRLLLTSAPRSCSMLNKSFDLL